MIGERHIAAPVPSGGRNVLVGVRAVLRDCQTGVQHSTLGDALANDLSGVESAAKVHKRSGIADEIVEVLRLCALPDQGAPEVRIIGSMLKPTISPRSLFVWQQPTIVAAAPGKAP